MAAPSANNKQPWFIIAVTDNHLLKALGEQLPYVKMTREAAVALVVCGNLETDPAGSENRYWLQGCSAVTENMLLAVLSMGLGALWTAAVPHEDRMETVRKILNLPTILVPLNVIPLGHREGTQKLKKKLDEAKFRFNGFPVYAS
jgi:nitroreductase